MSTPINNNSKNIIVLSFNNYKNDFWCHYIHNCSSITFNNKLPININDFKTIIIDAYFACKHDKNKLIKWYHQLIDQNTLSNIYLLSPEFCNSSPQIQKNLTNTIYCKTSFCNEFIDMINSSAGFELGYTA